uniref:Uncharacterized protein n=1 Tax=Ditylenchus dipsaci TaxID=166011 RepID=A0A915EST4_9BILA
MDIKLTYQSDILNDLIFHTFREELGSKLEMQWKPFSEILFQYFLVQLQPCANFLVIDVLQPEVPCLSQSNCFCQFIEELPASGRD